MVKNAFRRGMCPICDEEGVTSRHYSFSHGVHVRDHFSPTSSKGGKKYQLSCRTHRDVWVDGPHEAMKHLVEAHTEVLPGEQEGKMRRKSDPGLVTIANLVDFLVDKRRATEEEKAEIEEALQHLQEQCAEERQVLNQRIGDLERANSTLREQLRRATEENVRLSKTARDLNDEAQRLRRGVLSEKGRHALLELNR